MAGGKSKRSRSGGDVRTRRKSQLDQINAVLETSTTRLTAVRKDQRQCELLKSVADGLYEEIDKLSKKAPAESVTTLVLGEVNHLISQVKALGRDDTFIQRLKEFVPAGEAPEHRDAVVVMKLAQQGLQRVAESLSNLVERENARNREARLVKTALEYFLEDNEVPTRDDLRDLQQAAPDTWLTGYPSYAFKFERLDRMNISVYFERDFDEPDNEDQSEEG